MLLVPVLGHHALQLDKCKEFLDHPKQLYNSDIATDTLLGLIPDGGGGVNITYNVVLRGSRKEALYLSSSFGKQ